MTDIPIKIQFLKSLHNLKPNRVVIVKPDNASEFQLYVTDKSGIPFPIKDNTVSGAIASIINTDGNLTISGGSNKIINLSPSIVSLINGAIQSGDNISQLNNDIGYITVADIPDTKAEFNTQLTDGDFLFVGDITQYTDEDAQDAVGNSLSNSATIVFTYPDAFNQISASVQNDSITANELANNINISEFINNVGYVTAEQAQDAIGNNLLDTSTIDLTYNDTTGQISANVQANSITANELSDTINISEFINDSGFIDHADLATIHNASSVVITSDVGTDATINTANGLTAGVSEDNFTSAEKSKLLNIQANAQVNVLETLTSTGNTLQVGANISKNINLEVTQATETQLGGGQIATQTIIENEATTDDSKIVTPKKFWQGWTKGLTLAAFFNAVRGTGLTGLSFVSSRITSADSILSAFGKLQSQVNELQATRFLSGAGVTINGADNTKFDIQVVGVVVNPITFAETLINVNLTAQTTTYLATQVESYVWVNSSNAVVQSLTPPTPDLLDSIVGYWVLVHSNLTNINLVNSFPYYTDGTAIKVAQILNFIGFSKFPNTNIASAGTTGTRIQHTGGYAIKAGLGNTTKRPIINLIGQVDPSNMEMRHRNGVFSTGIQNIDVTNYNPTGSTVSALANNKFAVHKIWKFASGLIRIQYGQKEYANYNEAVAGINVDSFVDEGNAYRNGLHIGWLVFKKGTSWGTGGTGVDGQDYRFIDVKSNGSTGGLTPTMQASYDVSTQPQIVTSTSKGAVQYQGGTGVDTDHIWEGKNNAGTVTSWIAADGTSSFVSTRVSTGDVLHHQATGGAISSFGGAAPTTVGTGSNAVANFVSTYVDSPATTWNRRESTSSATAGSSAEFYDNAARYCAVGLGFYEELKFAIPITTANSRFFCGLYGSNAAMGNVNPSTLTDIVGIGSDSADANVFVMHNDNTGTATRIDTGINIDKASALSANQRGRDFILQIWNEYGSNDVHFRLKSLRTQVIYQTTVNTNLPSVNTGLTYRLWINNGTDASAVRMVWSEILIERNS